MIAEFSSPAGWRQLLVKAIAAGFMRRNVKRCTVDALAKAERAQRTFPMDVFDTARARSLGFGGMRETVGSVVAGAGAVE